MRHQVQQVWNQLSLQSKKFRDLKRKQDARNNDSINNEYDVEKEESNKKIKINASMNIVNIEEINKDDFSNITENEFALSDAQNVEDALNESDSADKGINEKILQWTLNNLGTLRLNVIIELLILVREERNRSLLKTTRTLLETKHHQILQIMNSNRKT